ncbi:hypothetical protein GCM10027575_32260 [Phytohabitans suffuscus]
MKPHPYQGALCALLIPEGRPDRASGRLSRMRGTVSGASRAQRDRPGHRVRVRGGRGAVRDRGGPDAGPVARARDSDRPNQLAAKQRAVKQRAANDGWAKRSAGKQNAPVGLEPGALMLCAVLFVRRSERGPAGRRDA